LLAAEQEMTTNASCETAPYFATNAT